MKAVSLLPVYKWVGCGDYEMVIYAIGLYEDIRPQFQPPMSDTFPNISYADVLIVGAGPAGLMAAHALAQGGIKVKLIDIR